MSLLRTEPISDDWTIDTRWQPAEVPATAVAAVQRLALLDAAAIAAVPRHLLHASAAELAPAAGFTWQVGNGDAPVALVRLIAAVAARAPAAGGPHTARLVDELSG